MSELTSITGNVLKHYGRNIKTNKRCIIIALQNETDKETCSVVEFDTLDSETRAGLVDCVNSHEAQSTVELWRVLNKKFFMNYPHDTMLMVLKKMKQIKVVPNTHIIVEVSATQTATVKQIIEGLDVYYSAKKKGHSSFSLDDNANEQTSFQSSVNNTEVENMKSDIRELKESVSSITESLSELIAVLKK